MKQGYDHFIVLVCKACHREYPPSQQQDLDRQTITRIFKCSNCRVAAKKLYDKQWADDHRAHRAAYMKTYRRERNQSRLTARPANQFRQEKDPESVKAIKPDRNGLARPDFS